MSKDPVEELLHMSQDEGADIIRQALWVASQCRLVDLADMLSVTVTEASRLRELWKALREEEDDERGGV